MPPGNVCITTRCPLAGRTSSQTKKCDAWWMFHMVMWPKTIFPSAVAGPVAANAEQWCSCGGGGSAGAGLVPVTPSTPVGVACRASPRHASSTHRFTPAMSVRSIGRPRTFAPAAAAPSAMPFISSRCSRSNRCRYSPPTSSRYRPQYSAGDFAARCSESAAMYVSISLAMSRPC